MKWRKLFVLGAISLCLAAPAWGETLVEIDGIREGALKTIGFELSEDAELEIEAVGVGPRFGRKMVVYAWILDQETRKPRWLMTRSGSKRHEDGGNLRHEEKTLKLAKGRYELYIFAGEAWQIEKGYSTVNLKEALSHLLGKRRNYDSRSYRRDLARCHVRVKSDKLDASSCREFAVLGGLPGTICQFSEVGDHENHSQAFHLDERQALRLYALAEIPERKAPAVDKAWIVATDTRERVWEMDWRNTRRAGGHKKNRLFNDEIILPAGDYILYYAADDSHSCDGFNVAPPFDPLNWGVALLPASDTRPGSISRIEEIGEPEPLLSIMKVRDNDYEELPFELKSSSTLWIQAMGEHPGGSRRFVDHAWIESLPRGRTVWSMKQDNTVHAGGAAKNRAFDGMLQLEAGKYLLCNISDDSHSFEEWNAARPFEPEKWGVAIYPGPGYKSGTLVALNEDAILADGNTLARLLRIGDNEHRRTRFTVREEGRLRVYALGEYSFSDDEFVDYAWIEDRDGDVIWEMTYRNTRSAGGARKNREFDRSITLDVGDYELHYISDGSHSFQRWNADRPDDPRGWGVMISLD